MTHAYKIVTACKTGWRLKMEFERPASAGKSFVFEGQTYTLAENIHWQEDGQAAPIEPRAQLVSPTGAEAYWYFSDLAELETWLDQEDYSNHLSGILTVEND